MIIIRIVRFKRRSLKLLRIIDISMKKKEKRKNKNRNKHRRTVDVTSVNRKTHSSVEFGKNSLKGLWIIDISVKENKHTEKLFPPKKSSLRHLSNYKRKSLHVRAYIDVYTKISNRRCHMATIRWQERNIRLFCLASKFEFFDLSRRIEKSAILCSFKRPHEP